MREVNRGMDLRLPLIAFAAMVLVWWFVVGQGPSAGDQEAEVFGHMQKSGASKADLCAQAKAVERAYVSDGGNNLGVWASIRQSSCLSEEFCRATIGCDPDGLQVVDSQ